MEWKTLSNDEHPADCTSLIYLFLVILTVLAGDCPKGMGEATGLPSLPFYELIVVFFRHQNQ
jgi:hypothetical protein